MGEACRFNAPWPLHDWDKGGPFKKLEETALANRDDLLVQFEQMFGPKNSWNLATRTYNWGYSASEVRTVDELDRTRAKPVDALPVSTNKHQPAGGPQQWIIPLHLPPTPMGTLTALIHAWMATPELRSLLLGMVHIPKEESALMKICVQGLWLGKRPLAKDWRLLEAKAPIFCGDLHSRLVSSHAAADFKSKALLKCKRTCAAADK